MSDLDTLCVHGGVGIDEATDALVPPLVQTTTYRWTAFDQRPAQSYAREGNPTVGRLEARLASLENGHDAVCFGSGIAAIDAVFKLFPPGSRVVVGRHVYGGTTRLLHDIHGGRFDLVTIDSSDRAEVEEALSIPTDLVLVETPTNPTVRITDLRHLIQHARQAGAFTAVDNTFLTPLWQRPLDLGADASIHSTTKYLDGHDATLGGAVILPERHAADRGPSKDGSIAARLRWLRMATGTNLAPFEAWLTLQGCKTLHLRTARQWENAGAVAAALSAHPAVERVHYPGLPDHPGHAAHRAQATGDGGIVAIDLGSLEAAATFVRSVRLFTLAENLGATESLVSSPALMTHAALPPERRQADGIPDGLVRLSLGVEDRDALISDLVQALDQIALEVPA